MDNTITQQSIMAQIAGLPKMETPDLKRLWQELYKEDAPRAPKTFLIRKLAYRIQELSFAQFEREVIGERIRDKFSASKRKGIWMGGVTPMGYQVQDRTRAFIADTQTG